MCRASSILKPVVSQEYWLLCISSPDPTKTGSIDVDDLISYQESSIAVYEAPGLDVCNGVAGHPIAGVLLAADDDAQLVGVVLSQPHHLQ